jgi:hypothetical protein
VTTEMMSTTIELNRELANLAYEMGLNVSKICENALKEWFEGCCKQFYAGGMKSELPINATCLAVALELW